MNFTTRMVLTTIDNDTPTKGSVLVKLLEQWTRLASALEEQWPLEKDQFLMWALNAVSGPVNGDFIIATVEHCQQCYASFGSAKLISCIANASPIMVRLTYHDNIIIFKDGFRKVTFREQKLTIDEQVAEILEGFKSHRQ